jgi:uncharacterized sodium:solute symporter family permease YidK
MTCNNFHDITYYLIINFLFDVACNYLIPWVIYKTKVHFNHIVTIDNVLEIKKKKYLGNIWIYDLLCMCYHFFLWQET